MAEGPCDVFISYRRESGAAEARLIRAALQERGLRIFLDVADLHKGYFDEALLKQIAETANFVVVLSPDCLDRCSDPDDWLRHEIVQAIQTRRNIIPLMLPGFKFPAVPDPSIKDLPRHQGLEYTHTFFEAMIDKLIENLEQPPQEKVERKLRNAIRSLQRYRRVAAVVAAALVLAVAVRVATKVREEVLAVLPFVTIESGPSAKAAAEGMAEGVATTLARFSPRPSRLVRRRLTVIPYRDVIARHVANTDEARRELGANRVVEGSIDRSAGRERMLLSIVDADTRHTLCAEAITDLSDPLAVEDRVAGYCAECLDLEGVPARAPNRGAPRVPEAGKFYQEGEGYLYGYDIPDSVDNAIKAFTRAVQLDPNFGLAYAGLGEAYWRKYEVTKDNAFSGLAQQSCDQAARLNDRLAEAHTCLGTLHDGAGEHAQAADEFSEATRLESRSDDAWRGLARAHSEQGNTKEAEQEYLKAISIRPYWGNYAELGEFYFDHARYTEAEAEFNQAIRQTPDNSGLYLRLGGVHIMMGRYDEAVKNLRQAIAHRPTFGAYDNLGTAYLSLGRFDEAIAAYQRALDFERGDHRAYGNLARATYWRGKRNEALPLYQRAVDLAQQQLNVNPQDRNAHIDLAWYYAMLGQRPEALNHLVSAKALESGEAEFCFIAAIVHNQFGERASALACLQRACDLGYSGIEIGRAPELNNLHGDTGFESIVSACKTPGKKGAQ